MDLNGTMLCAAGAAYNINGTIYTPDKLFNPQLPWTDNKLPVVYAGPQNSYIDACFVGQIDTCLDGQMPTSIIVSARGTLYTGQVAVDDWINDFLAQPVSWSYPFGNGTALPGNVHYGFYLAVQNVYAGILSTVQSLLAASPNTPVYVTGHSKGGGMAPLIAYLLQFNGISVARVVTFAAPKPGDTGFQTAYNQLFSAIHSRFENYGDIIPFLWPTTFVADTIIFSLSALIEYLTSWGFPSAWATKLIGYLQTAENWDYQPVGNEYYISLSNGVQTIVTSEDSFSQGEDLISNLYNGYENNYSVEQIFALAHSIGYCNGSTPIVGYFSAICPGLSSQVTCPDQEPPILANLVN